MSRHFAIVHSRRQDRHNPLIMDPDSEKPGTGTGDAAPTALNRPFGRLCAWLDMLIVDHGVLRLGWRHGHAVRPDFYRSSQPAPFQIRHVARFGIRTIVNLRGANDSGHYHLEREAAAEAGLALVDFPMKSRRAPPKATVLQALDLFGRIEYPVLVHCKSGIDRTGLMSALYLLSRGESASTALGQFARRFGYVGSGPTGIGKAFVAAYRDADAQGRIDFRNWVRQEYDPEALTVAFRPTTLSRGLIDYILSRE